MKNDDVSTSIWFDRVTEAREARDDLRLALRARGVTLPSLGLDPSSLATDPARPLVELGRVTPAVARDLARALATAEEAGRE
ncbi:hypothetical protein [Streptomyces sp. NPDC007088]|uniref:hypothetical protein n=1 Tax=Streptomyces sp. NPDC007088 TaxID=3364773 RepID=UPI0036C390F5